MTSMHELYRFLEEHGLLENKEHELKVLKKVKDLDGRYVIDGKYFRVSRKIGNPELSEAIYEKLKGTNVIPFEHLGVMFGDYRIDARKFVEGREYKNTYDDFCMVVDSLHEVHKALKDFKASRKTALAYGKKLETARDFLKEQLTGASHFNDYAEWLHSNRDDMKRIAVSFNQDYLDAEGSQGLHCDFHPGNVIISDKAHIFDFEKSYMVFAPVNYDLAYLMDRFCMSYSISAPEYWERMEYLKKVYGSVDTHELIDMMKNIYERLFFVVLNFYLEDSQLVDVTELDKFLKKYKRLDAWRKEYEE